MIQTEQIRDEITRLLAGLKPKEIYINLCPEDFKRPSFWLETVRVETADVNFSTVKVNAYFMITCYVELNVRGNVDTKDLTKAQENVTGLFRNGYIKVADRALTVKANTAGYDIGKSYVDLQFEYFDDRSDETDDTPTADNVETNLTVK